MAIYKFFCFGLLFFLTLSSFARDSYFINQTRANSDFNFREIGLGLPPIGSRSLMWTNSFSQQNSVDSELTLSQFRWTPGLISRLDEEHTLMAVMPFGYSSTSPNPVMSNTTDSQTFILTVNNSSPLNKRFSWSYGLLVLDSSYPHRVFPIGGLNYITDDELWQYSLAYPMTGISYLGISNTKLSFFYAREMAKFFITPNDALKTSGDYLEVTHNIVGFSGQVFLTDVLKLTLKAGRLFASRYNLLNSSFDKISEYKDYSGESYLSVGLGIDFSNLRKKADN